MGVIKIFDCLKLPVVCGRREDLVHKLTFLEQVIDSHQSLTSLCDLFRLDPGHLISHVELPGLLFVDLLEVFLQIGGPVVNQSLVNLHILLVVGQVPGDHIVLISVILLLEFELFVFGDQLLIPRQNVLELGELVRVAVLNLFQKHFEFFHGSDFRLNFLGLLFVNF